MPRILQIQIADNIDLTKLIDTPIEDGYDPLLSESRRNKKIEAATAAGNKVLFGNPYTLQLDCDGIEEFNYSIYLLHKFKKHLKIDRCFSTFSKSGNRHIYVYLKNPIIDRKERMLLQGTLGSDPVREMLNYKTAYKWECFLIEISDNTQEIDLSVTL